MTIELNCDAMEPLRGFLHCMAEEFGLRDADDQTRAEFITLRLVVNGHSTSPDKLSQAVHDISTATKDQPILFAFNAIAQGKRMIAQCQKACESRNQVNEACQKLAKVSDDCKTFQTALAGSTPNDSMKNMSQVVASYKSSLPSAGDAEDGAVRKALALAQSDVLAYAQAMLDAHFKTELVPWLGTQVKTLSASTIMTKPPAFAILNMKTVLGNSLEGAAVLIKSLADLQDFYSTCFTLATDTEKTLQLRTTPEEKGPIREATVVLCRHFKEWQEASAKLHCTEPSLFVATKAFSQSMSSIVADSCIQVWKACVEQPLIVLGKLMKNEQLCETKADCKSMLDSAQSAVSDARLVVTGFQKSDGESDGDSDRVALDQAAGFLDHIVQFAQSVHVSGSKASVVNSVFRMLKFLELTKLESVPVHAVVVQPDSLEKLGCLGLFFILLGHFCICSG